jgi:hypothetical protein
VEKTTEEKKLVERVGLLFAQLLRVAGGWCSSVVVVVGGKCKRERRKKERKHKTTQKATKRRRRGWVENKKIGVEYHLL